jgi:translation initiation factor 2 subunit 3
MDPPSNWVRILFFCLCLFVYVYVCVFLSLFFFIFSLAFFIFSLLLSSSSSLALHLRCSVRTDRPTDRLPDTIGYANAKLWQCDKHPAESTTSTASTVKGAPPRCALCDGAMRCVRHVSFVDCPGHSVLMTRMLSGASAMDAAIVVIAANLPCPQPQTFEHVAALQALGISNVFVVQNKVDLVDEATARENLQQIRSFLEGTFLEDCPVVPMSAQRGWNLAYLLRALLLLREPKRHAALPARITVIRSFCVNKCGCTPEQLRGGVAGGILVQGTVRVGDQLDIVPGLVIRQPDQSVVCKPLSTRVLSIFSDQTELDHALPGGLYGRCHCILCLLFDRT